MHQTINGPTRNKPNRLRLVGGQDLTRLAAQLSTSVELPPDAIRIERVSNHDLARYSCDQNIEDIMAAHANSACGQWPRDLILPPGIFADGTEQLFDVYQLLLAGDMPNAFPAELADLALLYIRLNPSREASISGQLEHCSLYSDAGQSRLLWDRTGYLNIADDSVDMNEPPKAPPICLQIGIEQVLGFMSYAKQAGVMFVAVECGQTLRIALMRANPGLIISMFRWRHAGRYSPEKQYRLAELQDNARALEESSQDVASFWAPHVVNLTCIGDKPNSAFGEADEALLESLGYPVNFEPGYQAVVGRLPKVARRLPHCRVQDLRHWLKIYVNSDFYGTYATEGGRTHLESVRLAEDPKLQCFLVVLRAADQMHVVALLSSDSRLSRVYETWARSNVCPIAIENIRNGHLTFAEADWPSEYVSDANSLEEVVLDKQATPWFTSDVSLRAAVVDMAMQGQQQVNCNCYVSAALTESEWITSQRGQSI